MTLTYWVARPINHSAVYSIREASKKKLIEAMNKAGYVKESRYFSDGSGFAYELPRKVTVTYTCSLDLLKQCLGEGGIYEG
jgi:hypothetical protein